MVGIPSGGYKAAKTNKEKYGEDFYSRIGSKGGRVPGPKGFAANPELARLAGQKGGRRSRRSIARSENREHAFLILKRDNKMACLTEIPNRFTSSYKKAIHFSTHDEAVEVMEMIKKDCEDELIVSERSWAKEEK